MSSHCYVGVIEPDQPHLAHARAVLIDGHPSVVLPALAAIWAGHTHYDTRALAAAVLACDWEYLDPRITADSRRALPGQHPVPGVGMSLAPTGGMPAAPEPLTVFPLSHARHLDVEWIYLIDADTATVAVHTDDGSPVARYALSGFLPHPAVPRRAEPASAAAGATR
ncbi:hypothetical protein [Micromonospora sp. NPDC050495]|uniref:hypothetical protein n=1 Tax=Micromonospora sp. NPDC050495 TaxID=3154936 RepID=UPI003409E0F7